MHKENSKDREQLLISIGLLSLSFLCGIPWIDIGNTNDALSALTNRAVSCDAVDYAEPPETLVLLSAGNETKNNSEPNYHEKRRVDALVYTYLELLQQGTPPRSIILALDDGIEKEFKIRNLIQRQIAKNSPGTELDNEIFTIVHADHTDSSLVAVGDILVQTGSYDPIAIITSEPHVNRVRYNSCLRKLPATVINADKVISINDPDTYAQMKKLKQLPSYQWAEAIEQVKILYWMYRPQY